MSDPRKLKVAVRRLSKFLDDQADLNRKARSELDVVKNNMPADSILKRLVRLALSGKGGEPPV